MTKFLMETSSVSDIGNEIKNISTNISSIISSIESYQTDYKGENSSSFDSAKKKIASNTKEFMERVTKTSDYINKCVSEHTSLQSLTYNTFLETISGKVAGNENAGAGGNSGGSGSHGGSGGSRSSDDDTIIGGMPIAADILGNVMGTIKTYYSETGQLTDQELTTMNDGFIFYPDSKTCIAPCGYTIGSQITISYSNSSLDSVVYTVVGNTTNATPSTIDNSYPVYVVSSSQELLSGITSTSAIINTVSDTTTTIDGVSNQNSNYSQETLKTNSQYQTLEYNNYNNNNNNVSSYGQLSNMNGFGNFAQSSGANTFNGSNFAKTGNIDAFGNFKSSGTNTFNESSFAQSGNMTGFGNFSQSSGLNTLGKSTFDQSGNINNDNNPNSGNKGVKI